MKKLIVLLMMFTLFSCSSYDDITKLEKIQKQFPKGTIYMLNNDDYTVVTDNGIYDVNFYPWFLGGHLHWKKLEKVKIFIERNKKKEQ